MSNLSKRSTDQEDQEDIQAFLERENEHEISYEDLLNDLKKTWRVHDHLKL